MLVTAREERLSVLDASQLQIQGPKVQARPRPLQGVVRVLQHAAQPRLGLPCPPQRHHRQPKAVQGLTLRGHIRRLRLARARAPCRFPLGHSVACPPLLHQHVSLCSEGCGDTDLVLAPLEFAQGLQTDTRE